MKKRGRKNRINVCRSFPTPLKSHSSSVLDTPLPLHLTSNRIFSSSDGWWVGGGAVRVEGKKSQTQSEYRLSLRRIHSPPSFIQYSEPKRNEKGGKRVEKAAIQIAARSS
jgi:hypothetical protein